MKKILCLIVLMFTSIIGVVGVSASETTYNNLITDETSIEEDFDVLGLDVNDYYLPQKYEYSKWYVVALSETYLDEDTIQTYLYLYNPTLYNLEDSNSYFPELTFYYSINNDSKEYIVNDCLKYDLTRSLYKVKGFTYDYVVDTEININKIYSYYDGILDEEGNYQISESYVSESTFKATTQHSKVDDNLTIEMNFNSTLIIEDWVVVKIQINEDDNFINNWNTFWDGKETSLDVYFYNFNFPDRIQPDKIIYAKFRYDYHYYYGKEYYYGTTDENGYYKEVLKEDISYVNEIKTEYNNINEYDTESTKLRVNENSLELTFPTFTLGNRIEKNEFGTIPITDSVKTLFDYDCSILLDSTYRSKEEIYNVNYNEYDVYYTELDDIEFLELHYEKDGIKYKCQVVVPSTDEEDVIDKGDNPELELTPSYPDKPDEKTWWEKIWEWFKEWFMNNMPKSIFITLAIIIFAPVIISLFIWLVFKIIIGVIALCIKNVPKIVGYLKEIIILLFKIVFLPFKIIGMIRRKKRYRGDRSEKW